MQELFLKVQLPPAFLKLRTVERGLQTAENVNIMPGQDPLPMKYIYVDTYIHEHVNSFCPKTWFCISAMPKTLRPISNSLNLTIKPASVFFQAHQGILALNN